MSRIIRLMVFRRRLFAAAIFSFAALASLLAYANAPRTVRDAFGPADDCPRGALVYAQVSDLPALLQLWDGSKLKEKYLASTNFKQFRNGHVALKLAARLQEFSDAFGFKLDAASLADATDKKAAIAVYDIGRMELVFVAPVGEEKALAARFFHDADSFDKTELPDGTVYYSHDVEADHGRQKQKILFAFVKGRFVLATDEQLMLRTLANVNGKSRADRLSDDPSFKTLSGEVSPHFASVWVDQSRLNGDYYFKHYWVMADAARLQGIRAGIFDFEMRQGSFLERREFLLEGRRTQVAPLAPRDVQELNESLPTEAAYSRVRVLADGAVGASSLVRNALLDGARRRARSDSTSQLHEEVGAVSEASADYSGGDDYSYLGDDYDESIDDPSDSNEDGEKGRSDADDAANSRLRRVIEKARPTLGAVAESPVTRDGPLFVEFKRLAILRLDEPGKLDVKAFEESVTSLVVGRLTAAGTSSDLKWSDAGEGARRRRELELPMLGWKLCYALRGRELFVSNDAAFLDTARAGGVQSQDARDDTRLAPDDLTVIRLDRKRDAFDAVFDRLDAKRINDYRARRGGGGDISGDRNPGSEEFFSGNVASLLDAASPISRVEIRRRSTPGRLHEEIEFVVGFAGLG